jgi:polyhydroxyalkanoate synthesis regulator phasin
MDAMDERPAVSPDPEEERPESGATLRDLLEKTFLLGVGAATITLDKAREAIEGFVERGHISAEDGRRLTEEVGERSREEVKVVLGRMQSGMQSTYKEAGLATKTDVEDVDFRIRQLEHRIRLLEEAADQGVIGGTEG